jgi:hypothetical protein
MGKNRRATSSDGNSHNMLEFQGGQLDFALEGRQERLKNVLERRRQAASTEAGTATPTTSGSADPITETPATSEAVPDNKEPRKSKKSKDPKAVKN